jgi:hypothetical protein
MNKFQENVKFHLKEGLLKKAKSEKKSWLTCDDCGKKKPDVERQLDPYALEIDGVEEYMNLCDYCATNRADDV